MPLSKNLRKDSTMRLALLDGRAVLVAVDGSAVDVHQASAGRFGPDVAELYPRWDEFREWAGDASIEGTGVPIDPARLGPPSPAPRQILAFGLNYADHAAESGFAAPQVLPPLFPKFVSSLSGPVSTVVLPAGGDTDWEIELVAVIGRETTGRVAEDAAWDHVAGLTVGQDISDRATQFSTPAPQFGLGKSFPGFAPTGPWLVTPDELSDRDSLSLQCTLDGQTVQEGNTKDLLFGVARLISDLSGIITLHPGDLIFTGTPEGVGLGRKPPLYIRAGQELVSTIEGIGELRQRFVAADAHGNAPRSQRPVPAREEARS